jgi:DNA helicase HerA-like ATPase
MLKPDSLYLGTSKKPEYLDLKRANRHGLITGATGTGKTVTLQILAEGFAKAGVPVFCSDIKGDLSGLAMSGEPKDFLLKRADDIGFKEGYTFEAMPVAFWDLFGKQGYPIRATISDMGPLLLARLMNLNDTQEGVLNIAFRIADDEGLLLLDLKDLRSMLNHVGENAADISKLYGNVSKASIGAIQRSLLLLEDQGGDAFFGEPALKISDLMRKDDNGHGIINVLAADKLMQSPRLYATFLLWLLSELFEELPEIGDPDKPELVFFFDEAHLLFDEAPKALLERVEQVVRLIRSKGVGVYFVTQNPLDVPESVLAQLGNRIQHALRAYTPRERKAVKTAADTFRPNPDFDAANVITELGIGEALVSTLEGKAVPSIVQRTLIRPPSSRLGPVSEQERKAIIQERFDIFGQYVESLDRESAYEILQKQAEEKVKAEERQEEREEQGKSKRTKTGFQVPDFGSSPEKITRRRSSNRQSVAEAAMKSVVRSISSSLGRALVRGILGSLKRGR